MRPSSTAPSAVDRAGPNLDSFGHFGVGGSLGFGDLEADLAFGYVMNHMGPRWQNPRTRTLIDVVYDSLAFDNPVWPTCDI